MKKLVLNIALIPALFIACSYSTYAEDLPIGDDVNDLPIFDAHVHYQSNAWKRYPLETVIQLMDKAGVPLALVSSTPDEGTIKLFEYAPNRIVPELRPYHGKAGFSNWTHADGMLDYIKNRLANHPHQGIGEFHIHNANRANKTLLTNVARLAVKNNIPVHVHSRVEPITFLYELEPKLTIIWAHAGWDEKPKIISAMLDKHPTLFADTSKREDDILLFWSKDIDPNWRELLIRHSDRFMVGSDTSGNGRWHKYERIIQRNRDWLRHLPEDVAKLIAYKNAERLFGRPVVKTLIGKH